LQWTVKVGSARSWRLPVLAGAVLVGFALFRVIKAGVAALPLIPAGA
jgi:hypothetical protein